MDVTGIGQYLIVFVLMNERIQIRSMSIKTMKHLDVELSAVAWLRGRNLNRIMGWSVFKQ